MRAIKKIFKNVMSATRLIRWPSSNLRTLRTTLPGFDPFYYLYWYPDVRTYPEGPFSHYIHHGWKEGRDPSGGFSTDGYLTANPDVQASKQNPLVHFVQHGFAEGRSGWQKPPGGPAPNPRPNTSLKLLAPPTNAT